MNQLQTKNSIKIEKNIVKKEDVQKNTTETKQPKKTKISQLEKDFVSAVNLTQKVDLDKQEIIPISDLENKNILPKIKYQSHVYSSNVERKYIKINDLVLKENEFLTPDIKILEIQQNETILQIEDKFYTIEALKDY